MKDVVVFEKMLSDVKKFGGWPRDIGDRRRHGKYQSLSHNIIKSTINCSDGLSQSLCPKPSTCLNMVTKLEEDRRWDFLKKAFCIILYVLWHHLSGTTLRLDILSNVFTYLKVISCGIIFKNQVEVILLKKQKSQIIIQFHFRTMSKLINEIFSLDTLRVLETIIWLFEWQTSECIFFYARRLESNLTYSCVETCYLLSGQFVM